MDTLTIRKKLHDYINEADDEKVEAMYASVKNETAGRYEWWNDEEFIADLDRQKAALDSGEEKGMTLKEATKHLLNRLK